MLTKGLRLSCDSLFCDSRSRGFTLIELIVFMTVVGIGVTGLVVMFNQGVQNSVDPVVELRALECAQAKLDEILARKFDENTPTGGVPSCGSGQAGAAACAGIAADVGLDDVGDFNGTVDNSMDNCSVATAVVEAGTELTLGAVTLPLPQARRISVTATSSGGGQVTLSAYRTNF